MYYNDLKIKQTKKFLKSKKSIINKTTIAKKETLVGKKVLILYPKFATIVKKKIMYFYYNHDIKEFYKIYRDIFNERIPICLDNHVYA